MSEASDYLDQLRTQMEVWDPSLGRNVYTGGNNAAYIASKPDVYKSYTGPVSHVGSRPITTEAYGMRQDAPPSSGPDPFLYRQAAQRQALYGENLSDRAEMDDFMQQIYEQGRILPGVRPNIGFVPGLGGINFQNMLPLDFYENQQSQVDPVEQRFIDIASSRGVGFPTLKSIAEGRNPYEAFSGRGYHYTGTPSTEEAALTEALLAGQPVNMGQLSQLRGSRIKANELSGLQKFASRYYGPLIAALAMSLAVPGIGAAFGPVAGAVAGAGAGAFTAGATSRWENPTAIAIGTAGGLAGAGTSAALSGATPILRHAASGAMSGLTREAINSLAGQASWEDILAAIASGALSGGITGGINNPYLNTLAAPAINALVSQIIPRTTRSDR